MVEGVAGERCQALGALKVIVTMLDRISYISVRALFAVLGVIPHRFVVGFFSVLWRLAFAVVPRLCRTARVEATKCDFSDLYADNQMSDAQKIERITTIISQHYCRMIADFPEGWFWIHRRWKTRPAGVQEDLYTRVGRL